MVERVRARDLGFLTAETVTAPRHNASVEILDPGPDGFDHDGFRRLVLDRIPFVPRYRQRLLQVPGSLAAPVWVDDEQFDLGYHVRRAALPRPGAGDELAELVARIVSRRLDRSRPLWEVYVVEGLADHRVALLSKSHQALVDGVHTVDLVQLLLDTAPEPKTLGPDDWTPAAPPSSLGLVAGAVADTARDPVVVLRRAAGAVQAAARTAERRRRRLGTLARTATGRPPPGRGPLFGTLSQQRRFVTVRTELATYRRIRDTHDGTVNDVVLATVAGGLRAWMLARSTPMGIGQVRAVVPVSVIDEELEATSLGSQIAAHLVDLPVGEASPVVRLHQVSYSFQTHADTGRSVAANRLAGVAGFAPTTFHAIGSRVAADELRRGYHLSVTNVPGPQSPLYAAGARMVATYPVPPLLERHPLAIGVTSYDGQVFYGLNGDRDALPDLDLLGTCITEALEELRASTTAVRAPRGRRRGPAGTGSRTEGKGTE